MLEGLARLAALALLAQTDAPWGGARDAQVRYPPAKVVYDVDKGAAAAMCGDRPADIHGFVEMVPMADAEIVRLRNDGYAYMR